MRGFRGALALAALALATAGTSVHAAQVQVGMKSLILSTVADTDVSLTPVKTMLEALGVDFDVLNVATDLADGAALPLTNPDGTGKYYAVFLTNRELGYEKAPGHWESALQESQWESLTAYQAAFGIRSVSLYSWPWWKGCVTSSSTVTPSFMQVSTSLADEDKAFNPSARVSTKHSWITPADCSGSVTVTSAAKFYSTKTDNTVGGDAMATEVLAPGAERLHFFFVPTLYTPGQVAALGLAVNWATRNLFLGSRRLNLAMQIDDLFLKTPEWTIANPEMDDNVPGGSRCTALDLQKLKAYQDSVTASLAPGSMIKYEWALNGQGVADAGGMASDPLGQEVRDNGEDFYYVTHTYTHPNLDQMSYAGCKTEIQDNIDMVTNMWGASTMPSTWGPNDIVPPSISGLFNGNCLRALQELGVNTEVGDNSRNELKPETYGGSPYHGLWTTQEVNGRAGTFIIPRHATNIFYNNAVVQNNIDHFNYITSLGWTWQQLLDYEADLTARYMMQYRHDPYMFHQANVLHYAAPTGFPHGAEVSLITEWTQAVLDEVTRFTNLPIVSWNMREMRESLLARMARDSCGLTAKVVMQDGIAVEVIAQSTSTCKLALTGITATGGANFEKEVYGPDRTVFVNISPASGPIAIPTGRTVPPPECNPSCSSHGTCNIVVDPPVCNCDLGWGGMDCATAVTAWGANFMVNPSFEDDTPGATTMLAWQNFGNGATAVSDVQHTGVRSARVSHATADQSGGLYQYLSITQATATPIKISGFSRPTNVKGVMDGNYAVYADFVLADGSWAYGRVAPFAIPNEGGTSADWTYAEYIYTPTQPVTAAFVYAMFRNHEGTVEFDDISVQMEVDATSGPETLDGKCGFNSEYNAHCPAGECCSDYGWCQTTCSTPPPEVTYTECPADSCWTGTTGVCQAANTVCYGLSEGKCPAGTTSCADLPALTTEGASVVEAEMTVSGITEAGFSAELQQTFENTVSDSTDATSAGSGTDITDVSTTSDAAAGSSSRRRRLSASATQCSVQGDTLAVRMTIASAPGGPSSEQLAANLKKSVESGDLDTRLKANGLGVKTQLKGDVRVADRVSSNSGVSPGIVAGVVVIALAVGIAMGAGFILFRNRGADPLSQGKVTRIERVDQNVVKKSNSLQTMRRIASRAGGAMRPGSAATQRDGEEGRLLELAGAGATGAKASGARGATAVPMRGDEVPGGVTPRA